MSELKEAAEQKGNPEQAILEAAELEFLIHGFDGARTQKIADRAGVNKALLHYYFRSKDALFKKVIDQSQAYLCTGLELLNQPETSLTEKIEKFIIYFWRLAQEKPQVLHFLQTEFSRSQNRFEALKIKFEELEFTKQFKLAVSLGEIKDQDPYLVWMMMLSLCFYPISSFSMLQTITTVSAEVYKEHLRSYYERIPSILFATIKRGF